MSLSTKDKTFIRTQADAFSWACVGAQRLRDLEVIDGLDQIQICRIAAKVLAVAREDPVFVGDIIAQHEVDYRG